MIRVNREVLLSELESVDPGLAPREVVEQSSSFIFKSGKVITYNDEVACWRPCCIAKKGVECAVKAEPLKAILRKLPEEDIEIEFTEKEMVVTGKKRRAGIAIDAEVTLPFDNVEDPGEWKPLAEDFGDAVSVVQECVSKDESCFALVCIHVCPKWIEATDDYQVIRYKVKTPIAKKALVRKAALQHVISLGMTEIAESENWLHFRNPTGLVLACRSYEEEFPDIKTAWDTFKGTPTIFPKGLAEAVERSEVFSVENPESNHVRVELRAGKMRVSSEGASGWYNEVKTAKYKGDPICFLISPKLLSRLVRDFSDYEITEDKLKAVGSKFIYVACLTAPDASEPETEDEDDGEEE